MRVYDCLALCKPACPPSVRPATAASSALADKIACPYFAPPSRSRKPAPVTQRNIRLEQRIKRLYHI